MGAAQRFVSSTVNIDDLLSDLQLIVDVLAYFIYQLFSVDAAMCRKSNFVHENMKKTTLKVADFRKIVEMFSAAKIGSVCQPS